MIDNGYFIENATLLEDLSNDFQHDDVCNCTNDFWIVWVYRNVAYTIVSSSLYGKT